MPLSVEYDTLLRNLRDGDKILYSIDKKGSYFGLFKDVEIIGRKYDGGCAFLKGSITVIRKIKEKEKKQTINFRRLIGIEKIASKD